MSSEKPLRRSAVTGKPRDASVSRYSSVLLLGFFRRWQKIRLQDLVALRAGVKKAMLFITCADYHPGTADPKDLDLRNQLAEDLPPARIWWLADSEAFEPETKQCLPRMKVPREFLQLARFVACHRSPDRWSMLYQVLWRLTHGEPHVMALSADPLISRMNRYNKSVHRDLHKMKAFVRFKKLQATDSTTERFVAWFEPEYFIVPLATDFFVRRFTNMRWSLLTPVGSAHWEGRGQPTFSEGLKDA